MVRLVFRPYTQLRGSICTSESLRSSIRVSADFNLARLIWGFSWSTGSCSWVFYGWVRSCFSNVFISCFFLLFSVSFLIWVLYGWFCSCFSNIIFWPFFISKWLISPIIWGVWVLLSNIPFWPYFRRKWLINSGITSIGTRPSLYKHCSVVDTS